MRIRLERGDILHQQVDAVVHLWQGSCLPIAFALAISGWLLRRAGIAPLRELQARGAWRQGKAVLTGAGKLPYRGIIHAPYPRSYWRTSDIAIRAAVAGVVRVAQRHRLRSIALPLIGAGFGGYPCSIALAIMCDELDRLRPPLEIILVIPAGKGSDQPSQPSTVG